MPKVNISLSKDDVQLLEKEWDRIDSLCAKSITNLAPLSNNMLARAHNIFFEKEKRDVFYRVVRAVLPKAIKEEIDISVPDILEILLQTWNRQYYRFHPWSNQHHSDIEGLINDFQKQLTMVSDKDISSCKEGISDDEGWIWLMFRRFMTVLGPVGAAKAVGNQRNGTLFEPNTFV